RAGEADRDRVVHECLALVDDRRRQILEPQRGDEFSQPKGERRLFHGWSIIRRMRPHEETISVGGTGVHTWIGGQGAPLLVLHGAGGHRGLTRWVRSGF